MPKFRPDSTLMTCSEMLNFLEPRFFCLLNGYSILHRQKNEIRRWMQNCTGLLGPMCWYV